MCAQKGVWGAPKGSGRQKGVVLREKVLSRGAPKGVKKGQKGAKRSHFEKTVVTFLHMTVDR